MNSIFLSLPTFLSNSLKKKENKQKITLFIHIGREAFTSAGIISEPKIYALTHLAAEIKSFCR